MGEKNIGWSWRIQVSSGVSVGINWEFPEELQQKLLRLRPELWGALSDLLVLGADMGVRALEDAHYGEDMALLGRRLGLLLGFCRNLPKLVDLLLDLSAWGAIATLTKELERLEEALWSNQALQQDAAAESDSNVDTP